MKALHFGPGAIGGGVAMPMAQEAGIEVIVAARNATRKKQLQEFPGILVRKVDDVITESLIGLPQVIDETDAKALRRVVLDPELRFIFTAVGASNLAQVAQVLAPALSKRDGPPVCILPFENVPQSGQVMQNLLLETPGAAKDVFTPSVVVDCMAFRETDHLIIREEYEDTVISQTGDPEFDNLLFRLPRVTIVGDIDHHYLKKIHLVSAIHTAIAWLGIHSDFEFTNQAASSPRFQSVLSALVEEMAEATCLVTGNQFNRKELLSYGRQTISRVANPKLGNPCKDPKFTRNLADKLSPTARFGKPAVHLFSTLTRVPPTICKIIGLGLWLGMNVIENVGAECAEMINQLPTELKTAVLEFAENPVLC